MSPTKRSSTPAALTVTSYQLPLPDTLQREPADHPDFTQELPRRLPTTSANESPSHLREKRYFTTRCLSRVGSGVKT